MHCISRADQADGSGHPLFEHGLMILKSKRNLTQQFLAFFNH